MEVRALFHTGMSRVGQWLTEKTRVKETNQPGTGGSRAAGIRELARPLCSEKDALAVAPDGARGPGRGVWGG